MACGFRVFKGGAPQEAPQDAPHCQSRTRTAPGDPPANTSLQDRRPQKKEKWCVSAKAPSHHGFLSTSVHEDRSPLRRCYLRGPGAPGGPAGRWVGAYLSLFVLSATIASTTTSAMAAPTFWKTSMAVRTEAEAVAAGSAASENPGQEAH